MIVLGNQLALQFGIGDKTDFLDIEDFHYMRIAENAGGVRPIIDLTFQVTRADIIPYLNNGNIITLMYGIKEPTSDILQFEICGDQKTKDYNLGSTISLLGGMYNRGFTSSRKSIDFKDRKSYEVIQKLALQNGMNFQTNVSRTNDKQTWHQNGMTDWSMLKYVASRAYKDNSTFFSYGFDNNNIYLYDVKEKIKKGVEQGADWILTVRGVGRNENDRVVNIGSYHCDDSTSGQNAELAGRNMTVVGYNLDTGEITEPSYSLQSYTTMETNKINVNSTGCRNYDYRITTGDEHANSISALNQNKRNNILFSSYRCYVPVAHQYRDFRLLDTVQLIPSETDKEAEGIYLIAGIAKEYKNNQFNTILALTRESANGIQGDLQLGGS